MRTTIFFCTLPFVACLAPAADPPPESLTTDEPNPSTSTTSITSTDPSTEPPTSTNFTISTTTTPLTSTDPSTSSITSTTSVPPYCGDNHKDLELDEECDLGSDNTNSGECTLECKSARCGDGLIYERIEQCDDQNDINTDLCTNECRRGICGDAFVQPSLGEECEDGNKDSNDACTNQCKWAICGDGILQTGVELCDDGNADQTDECLIGCIPASCGDGFVQDGVEVCDDNKVVDGNGCTDDCKAEERFVFVTSKAYNGRMDILNVPNEPNSPKGLELADKRCQDLATGKLPGTYKAWLSTDEISPTDRFTPQFVGVYRLPSPGYPIVATGFDAITTNGTLLHTIDSNESGATVLPKEVWTSTTQNGLAMKPNCNGWTDNNNTASATFGKTDRSDKNWTNNGSETCNHYNRLYCFQYSP